jgi:acetoin utilization deacetylase AcuC-like enzyme
MIGVVSDPLFMNHDTGGYHPEAPLRVHYIHTLFSGKDPGIAIIDPVRANVEDIMLNHERSHIEQVKRSCIASKYVDLDPDTVCSEDSSEVALCAAGSLIKLVELALEGEIDAGFASVRPPGHHATPSESMGFCLFNNVAIAARKAIQAFGIQRVIIIDFDVHHGNGTQDSFYQSKDVLYFSSHQYPFYPGTGRINETGARGAEGYTINCPLKGGTRDSEMVALYRSVMVPVIQAFNPGLILVSAGFDAHAMDPIGGMEISSAGFGALAGLIRDAAVKIKAPVVYSLEGGYNFDALRDSVKAVLDVMKGGSAPKIEERFTPEIDEIIKKHSRFWSL